LRRVFHADGRHYEIAVSVLLVEAVGFRGCS
jgi:hypothetical protein